MTWREVTRCTKCLTVFDKQAKWMENFFVPVCPSCGAPNGRGFSVFERLTARPIRSRWLKMRIGWEIIGVNDD